MATTSGFEPENTWSFPSDLPGSFESDEGHESSQTEDNDPSHPNSSQAGGQPEPQPGQRHYPPRTCRICFDVVQPTYHPPSENLPGFLQGRPYVTYESSEGGRLLRPCKCKGSSKFVHEECLQQWRYADPLNSRNYWHCPTCGFRYRLGRMTWARWIGSTGVLTTIRTHN
jgi:hypothetical protein